MNDRYLYRAKRKDNGEWIGGSAIDNPELLGREYGEINGKAIKRLRFKSNEW